MTSIIKVRMTLSWKFKPGGKSSNLTPELNNAPGLEICQCRRAKIQKNRKACAMLVWNHLKKMATILGITIDHLKHQLLSKYLVSELKYPTIKMTVV